MSRRWAARLVLCIAAAACLCIVCAAKDPVTLHRIVTSSEGCGPDRTMSAKQCEQFAAAGVQCLGNVSNGTSTYRGDNASSMFLLGCACSNGSVYFRSPQNSTSKDESCSLSDPCICEFLPALDNCTQGTFFNATMNITIRCKTLPAPSTIIHGMTLAGFTPLQIFSRFAPPQILPQGAFHTRLCLYSDFHGGQDFTCPGERDPRLSCPPGPPRAQTRPLPRN